MSSRETFPGLAAVELIAALAGAVGLALAAALLVAPGSFGWRHVPVLAAVVGIQGLAWWWVRRPSDGRAHSALALVAANNRLTLWAAAELVALVLLWGRGTASWSRVDAAWTLVAAYATARAALLALGIAFHGALRSGVPGRTSAARGVRLAVLGAALAAPVLAPLTGRGVAGWQGTALAGALALVALAAWARDASNRNRWVGLAVLVASPGLALAGCTWLVGAPALPLAAPVALTTLLPALGLASLAAPLVLAPAGPR